MRRLTSGNTPLRKSWSPRLHLDEKCCPKVSAFSRFDVCVAPEASVRTRVSEFRASPAAPFAVLHHSLSRMLPDARRKRRASCRLCGLLAWCGCTTSSFVLAAGEVHWVRTHALSGRLLSVDRLGALWCQPWRIGGAGFELLCWDKLFHASLDVRRDAGACCIDSARKH